MYFNKGIRQQIDIDYWEKLSEAEKQWLMKFCSEFYFGYFHSKEFEKKAKHKNIHGTEQRKAIRRNLKSRFADSTVKGIMIQSDFEEDSSESERKTRNGKIRNYGPKDGD